MGKIDELIKQLCPDGVKSVILGEVCKTLKKGTLKTTELVEGGEYPVINSGRDWYGFYDNFNNLGNAITIAARGEYAGFVTYVKEPFWAGGLCYPYRSVDENILITKFLFYVLKNKERENMDKLVARGSIPALNKGSFEKIEIPLPPLAVQKEIAEVLDTFTGMIDNLQKELEQRQKQFEHYRDQLLTFKEDECKYSKLADVCEVINGRAYKQSELLSDGKYRVLRVGNFFSNDSWYYSNLELDDKNYCQKGDLLYAWSASFGPRIWKEEKVVFHYHIWKMACSDGLDRVFFYYWLQSHDMERQVSSGKHGATMAHLTKKLMESLMIPVPSLEKQQEIVDKLDTFEALISNIKQEIELRQKQYEYYREKLLTFE